MMKLILEEKSSLVMQRGKASHKVRDERRVSLRGHFFFFAFLMLSTVFVTFFRRKILVINNSYSTSPITTFLSLFIPRFLWRTRWSERAKCTFVFAMSWKHEIFSEPGNFLRDVELSCVCILRLMFDVIKFLRLSLVYS